MRFHRALAALIFLTACGPRDAQYDVSDFTVTGAGAPPEIVLPAGFKPGDRFGGIVTITPASSTFCCVANAHIDVPVRKDGLATDLVIGAYVAKTGPSQRLHITFPDGSTRSVNASRDFSLSRVPLPANLRASHGPLRVRIDATNAPYTLVSIYFE